MCTYLTTQTHVVNRDAMTDTKFTLIFTIQNALKLHILSVAEQFHSVTMMIEHTYMVAKTHGNAYILHENFQNRDRDISAQ